MIQRRPTTARNIRNYLAWIVPIIIASKAVRWTIMKPQLVDMSIGWGFVPKIRDGAFTGFGAAEFGVASNAATSVSDNAISFFQMIDIGGFASYQTWEAYITLLFNVFVFFAVKGFYKRNPYAGAKENFFIYLNVAILNIFCFNLAKEPYQMIFFFLMAAAISVPRTYMAKTVALGVALVVTILYSRKYFGLVLMYFVILSFLVDKLFGEKHASLRKAGRKSKWKTAAKLALMAALFGGFHYVFMGYLQGANEDTYEEMVAANSRDWTPAASEITPLFPNSNPALLAVDYFIKIFRLMFPIELLFKLKFTYLFLIVYQWLLAMFLMRTFRLRDKKRNPTRTVAMYLYIAFLLCSAAFEPDFGSWIRHQGVAFPIILLLI